MYGKERQFVPDRKEDLAVAAVPERLATAVLDARRIAGDRLQTVPLHLEAKVDILVVAVEVLVEEATRVEDGTPVDGRSCAWRKAWFAADVIGYRWSLSPASRSRAVLQAELHPSGVHVPGTALHHQARNGGDRVVG